MKFTNNQIRKLGETIRISPDNITDSNLDLLQNFRISHKTSLSQIFSILHNESKQVNPNVIVSHRVKRIESIINKLLRLPTQELDRMWDIGGCRCILPNQKGVEKLLGRLQNKLTIKKINDHRNKPNREGYSALHLYCTYEGSLPIEIQIRTSDEHNWATFVEIIDLIYNKRIKEGENDEAFIRFHYMLSKTSELSSNETFEILKFVDQHNVYNKLREIFIRNYFEVRINWINSRVKKKNVYYILETQVNEVPKITPFDSYNQAEVEYFKLYKSKPSSNVVLIYLSLNNFESLEKAYANYLLTMHAFQDDYFKLLEKAIITTLKRRNLSKFRWVYQTLLQARLSLYHDLMKEIQTMKINSHKKDTSKELHHWFRKFMERSDIIIDKNKQISNAILSNMPSGLISNFRFRRAMKTIESKYNFTSNK